MNQVIEDGGRLRRVFVGVWVRSEAGIKKEGCRERRRDVSHSGECLCMLFQEVCKKREERRAHYTVKQRPRQCNHLLIHSDTLTRLSWFLHISCITSSLMWAARYTLDHMWPVELSTTRSSMQQCLVPLCVSLRLIRCTFIVTFHIIQLMDTWRET